MARLRLPLAPVLASMADYLSKARFWMAICYPENMLPDWENVISSLLQVPYCYIIHDSDLNKDGVERKTHVHVLIVFPNTTTYSCALSVFKTLQNPLNKTCIPNDEIRQVRNIRSVYDYFIHNTKECRELGKHLYSPDKRICGNGFDIGLFEQLGQAEKDQIITSITDFIFNHDIQNFADLVIEVRNNFDPEYFGILKANSGFFQALTKGMYLKGEAIRREREAKRQEFQLAITRHHKKQRKKNVNKSDPAII